MTAAGQAETRDGADQDGQPRSGCCEDIVTGFQPGALHVQVGVAHGGAQMLGAPQQLLRMHLSPGSHSADVVQDPIVLHKVSPTQAGVPSVVVTHLQAFPAAQDVAWQLSPVTAHDPASVVVVVVVVSVLSSSPAITTSKVPATTSQTSAVLPSLRLNVNSTVLEVMRLSAPAAFVKT